MTQPDLNITTALEAIAEGLYILQLLAGTTNNLGWLDDSIPLSKLNELAQSLGYRDAQSVYTQVEHDRDMEECHAKIRQLRAELVQAKVLAALVTPELAALLERLANDAEYISTTDEPYRYMTVSDTEAARALAARIREALALKLGANNAKSS